MNTITTLTQFETQNIYGAGSCDTMCLGKCFNVCYLNWQSILEQIADPEASQEVLKRCKAACYAPCGC